MKKTFYALSSLFAAISMSAQDDVLLWTSCEPNSVAGATMFANITGSADNPLTMTDECAYENLMAYMAVKFDKKNAAKYAGCTVTGIRTVSGVFDSDPASETMRVSLAYGLDEEPVFTAEYHPVGSEFDYDTFDFRWNHDEVTVPEELGITIDGDRDIYLIYEYVDATSEVSNSPFAVAMPGSGSAESYTALQGSAVINGENHKYDKSLWMAAYYSYWSYSMAASLVLSPAQLVDNAAEMISVSAPFNIIPGQKFDVSFTFRNAGVAGIDSITAECDINSEKTEKTFEVDNIGIGGYATLTFDGLSSDADGIIGVELSLTKVNGVDNEYDNKVSGRTSISALSDGFARNVVVEEGTGTWCGYCPRGIVTMDKMNKLHDDGSFIGLAVHSGDDMEPEDADFILDILDAQGYPTMMFNRESFGNAYFEETEKTYNEARMLPAAAGVHLEAWMEDDGLRVNSEVEFAVDDYFSEYRVAFVLVENGVGPYFQQNNYSGSELEVFGELGGVTQWTYDDVVRSYDGCDGIKGSVPSPVVKTTAYKYEQLLSTNSVSNKANVWVAALLINATNGCIVNAAKCVPTESGVQSMNEDESNTEYFNMQGMKVNDPKPGQILIRRCGLITDKVMF